jgi:transcriptional regulator with XRE-family HTH domain
VRLYVFVAISYRKLMKPLKEQQNLASFGKEIAELRRKRGLTQDAVAEQAGIATHSLAHIEQGRRWPSRLSTIQNIAQVLKVKTSRLFRDLRSRWYLLAHPSIDDPSPPPG